MAVELDALDTSLLNLIQGEIPLDSRPFMRIAEHLRTTQADVLQRIESLKSRRIIRQISAIFDSKALGYQSTLVAAKVPEGELDHAVTVINAHPGVSHNYLRNHEFNLWYTLAVPPDSKLGLERTLEILHQRSHAESTRLMPTLRLFKIGVKLNIGEEDLAGRTELPKFTQDQRDAAITTPLSPADKRLVRVLQQDLPIVPRPFDALAAEAGVSVEQLLAAAQRYIDEKRMRRYSAVLRHREVGFSANGMGVWVVADDQQERFGQIAAGFSAVSHCYKRPTYPDWPYTLFTMVHAPTKEACDNVLAVISSATGVKDYSALYSSKEFKKVRVQYFLDDIPAWEVEALAETQPVARAACP
jgi:DNA-binding Lrp family transcriptional regulator